MEDNTENKQKPEEVAENVVKTGTDIAETLLDAADEFSTEKVIPTLTEGIKSLMNDENSKETVDKVSDAARKTSGLASKIIRKIIKTGFEILTDDVIPTVSEIARGEDKKE